MAKLKSLVSRLDDEFRQECVSVSASQPKKRALKQNDESDPGAVECSENGHSTGKVRRNTRKGYWWQMNSNRMASLMICLTIVNIPIICIYVGYSIGTYFMPPEIRFPSQGIIMDVSSMNYSWYSTHNITTRFFGGLGNQMFQYASLFGLGKANGLKPLVGDHAMVAKTFRMLRARRTNETDAGKDYGFYQERKSNAFDQRTFSLNFMRNIRLEGFFQSWRYFDHIRSDLRKQFAFRSGVVKLVDEFLREAFDAFLLNHHDEMQADEKIDVKFVGIHVRRGDFLDRYNVEKGYTVADVFYLSKAIRYYENKYKRVIFVVCTDDLPWSQENLSSSKGMLVFSKFQSSPQIDMCLLSKCNHSIITVGTFGWWGAWLAGGETVYYRDYPKLETTLRDSFRMSDYYLPQWIAM